MKLLLLTAAALLTSTGVASAATPAPTGDGAKRQAACEAAVDARLKAEQVLQTTVASTATTTADHRATLSALLATSTAGLTSLRASLAADTGADAVKADCAKIVPDYRVYLVVTPQVTLVVGADADLAAATTKNLEPALKATILAAKAAGKDTTAAQKAYDDLAPQVGVAQAAAGPVAGTVLPLTPAGYPGSTTTLENAAAQVKAATKAMAKAAQDVTTISALAS